MAKMTQVLADRAACKKDSRANPANPDPRAKPLRHRLHEAPGKATFASNARKSWPAPTEGPRRDQAEHGRRTVPSPTSANPGDDKDPCPKGDDPKPDTNFYTNMGNGIAAGIGGLLLASFFGGPLLMLAAAVVCGVGAYYLSKSIDDPPSPAKKDKEAARVPL